ncbi:DNA binding methylated-DNA-cysteine S-methyltransferase [Pilatotrama ljubarskyi]|nr:DNA binding methylated-DNA-cysteine S-methyltransferase [Pilatotrama ljubarskyi]
MDGDEFHAAVYHVVRQIPPQRVTSYGHIAKLIGMPNYSRHVGQALKFISPDVNPPIPWHRVLSSSGAISSRGPGTDGAARQRDALVAEGVEVEVSRSGGFKVDLRTYGWFPAVGTVDIGVQQGQDEGDGEAERVE